MPVWYEVEKSEDGIINFMECNWHFHDFLIGQASYFPAKQMVELLMEYDTPNGGNNILQQNPKITKIEADIAKNSKAIAYHQDKIGILEKANEGLNSELQQLKNNDIVMLVAMANLNFET